MLPSALSFLSPILGLRLQSPKQRHSFIHSFPSPARAYRRPAGCVSGKRPRHLRLLPRHISLSAMFLLSAAPHLAREASRHRSAAQAGCCAATSGLPLARARDRLAAAESRVAPRKKRFPWRRRGGGGRGLPSWKVLLNLPSLLQCALPATPPLVIIAPLPLTSLKEQRGGWECLVLHIKIPPPSPTTPLTV